MTSSREDASGEREVLLALAESPTVPQALHRALSALCSAGGWRAGAFWTFDPSTARLRWLLGVEIPEGLEAECRGIALPLGEGRIGLTASTRRAHWESPAEPAAERYGFRGSIAFPVQSDAGLGGVVALYSLRPRDLSGLQAGWYQEIGGLLGRFLRARWLEGSYLSAILESAPMAILTVDLEGRITFWGRGAEKLFGYGEAEIFGQPLGKILAVERREIEHLVGERREWIGRNRSGESFPLEAEWARWSSGESAYVTGFARRRVERGSWGALLEETDWAVAICRAEGRAIESMNASFARMHGYSVEELIGRPFDELLAPEHGGQISSGVLRRSEEDHRPYESRHVRKDGTIFSVSVNTTAIRDSEGRTRYRAFQVQDITERKQLEDRRAQAQKLEAIGRLAGGIAHDFNNLLMVINGYSQLLIQRLPPESEWRSDLEQIRQAGGRAATLTGQLLAFSRKQMLRPKVLNLNVVVADMAKMLQRVIGEDIELATAVDSEPAFVRVDPVQVEQMILNLAINARDAMPQGGRLTIVTGRLDLEAAEAAHNYTIASGPYVTLRVSDTGCGMDENALRHCFEPFFTTKEKGTGLGLAAVYGVVKQSQGYIKVESALGEGTAFLIYLPREQHQEDSTKVRAMTSSSRAGSETILIVEDEPAVRGLLRQVLSAAGYVLLEATDGEEGLRLCRQHRGRIDLLVTDVVMPRMRGPELARRAREIRPDLKVIFVSGYAESERLALSPDEEATLLAKPVSPDVLLRMVRESLDQATSR